MIQFPSTRLLQNFAHVMTAKLSWHVQNSVAITYQNLESDKNIYFMQFWIENLCWNVPHSSQVSIKQPPILMWRQIATKDHSDITLHFYSKSPWNPFEERFMSLLANEGRCYIETSPLIGWAHTQNDPWIQISMRLANERWCYNVMLSLIGWVHGVNDPWIQILWKITCALILFLKI